MGIAVPSATMVLVAAIYAGTTHRQAVPVVIAAAMAAAILGDNAGYVAGREGGYRLLRRYGPVIGLNVSRQPSGSCRLPLVPRSLTCALQVVWQPSVDRIDARIAHRGS